MALLKGIVILPRPNPSVLFQELADGAILLDPEQEVYFGLNAVGAHIWRLLPPACKELDEICETLGRHYQEVDSAVLEADVRELLEALLEHGLVTGAP